MATVLVILDDEELLHVALDGLPLEYDSFSSAIRTCSAILSIKELNALLKVEERAIKKRFGVVDVHPLHRLLITNLKVLVEEEGETTVREVVKDMEVEAISLLALVVTMLVQMEALIIVCLSLISLANQNLLGFKVKLNDHNVKFVERMDMWLWIGTTRWIFIFKVSMLHQNLQ